MAEYKSPFGTIDILTSPYAPPGTAFIVDMSAFEIERLPIEIEPAPVPRDGFMLRATARFTMRTHTERDPMQRYGLPRSIRAWWRLTKALYGYEYRKASKQLRQVPDPPPAMLTGLVV